MTVIEVQNKINFRNIIILFLIGLVGVINGLRDFSMYQIVIAKILFPDPVTYQNVMVLNKTMVSTMNVQSSMSVGGLAAVVIFGVIITGIIGGMCGTLGAMGD